MVPATIAAVDSDRSIARRRYVARLVITLSGLSALFVAASIFVFVGLDCSSGDGGVPYVAEDSAQADVCDATGDGAFLTLGLLVAALTLLVLVHRLGAAWVRGARRPAAFFALRSSWPCCPQARALPCPPSRRSARRRRRPRGASTTGRARETERASSAPTTDAH